jgi:flagellar protein FliS
MYASASQAYLESRILSADPVELVRMLYQGAIARVRDARDHLAAGDIAARSRAISKAIEMLSELTSSLDHDRGGEIAARLSQLYDYMQRRLLEANFQQADPPLADVLGLLMTLAEGWEGVSQSQEPAPVRVSPWTANQTSEGASSYFPQSWAA